VAVEIVARCFLGALDHAETQGQTYEVCGPDRLTYKQFLDAVLKAAGRNRFKLSIPLPLARIQATILEGVFSSLLHKPPPLTRDQLVMMQEDNVGNAEAVERLFNLKQTSFEEGIREYL
jgi:NADH dehydrogenase